MSHVLNRVRRGFYADSVALMRVARELNKDGVEASLMIGTPSNKALLKESGLLTTEGESARQVHASFDYGSLSMAAWRFGAETRSRA